MPPKPNILSLPGLRRILIASGCDSRLTSRLSVRKDTPGRIENRAFRRLASLPGLVSKLSGSGQPLQSDGLFDPGIHEPEPRHERARRLPEPRGKNGPSP